MENVTQEFVKELQSQGKKLLIQYTAKWCGPCKSLTPKLEKIENDYPNVKFVKVDVDENRNEIIEIGIMAVPTVMVFNGSNLVDRSTGLNNDSYYKNILNEL